VAAQEAAVTISFQGYLQIVCRWYADQAPDWRLGQTYFEVLKEQHPTLAAELSGTPWDPYDDDRRLPFFLETVHAKWEEVT
jgi:hypothetical protein